MNPDTAERPLYFCGDVHGDFEALRLWSDVVEGSDIIQVGDFGVGFRDWQSDESILRRLGSAVSARNNRIFAIRGNHDRRDWFDGRQYDGLSLVKDGTVLSLHDETIFCWGGAHSVDRTSRTRDIDWWRDEIFDWNGELPDEPISILITHAGGPWTGLTPKAPFLNGWHARDKNLHKDLQSEIQQHHQLGEALLKANHPLKAWYCGHYHLPLHGQIGNARCRTLDINEIVEWRY